MVMSQSLYRLLKEREPERPLDVLAPGWSLPVVERMPEVRQAFAIGVGHGEFGFGKRRRLGLELRDRYDRAIVLPRSFKSALVPWFAGIDTRTGYRGETRHVLINDMRPFSPEILDQTVKRYVTLGLKADEALPAILHPALVVSEEKQRAAIERLAIGGDRPVIAMMPGAEYGPAKCWPFEKYAELANRVVKDGYDVWILGSEKDDIAGQAIAAASPALNLCGQTSLEDVIDLLGFAEQAVSNDSGLMHVAAAVGTHTHAIYGSSSPLFTPPLTGKADVHYLDLDCSPCFERECPLGHLRCLRELDAAAIHVAIRRQNPERSAN
jgi:lipopolysaccharide heptosyltransferase II